MNPQISVIVPVYNVEQYLEKCIDSILNQTFKEFEIILVDDGSIDKSGDICDEYAKKDKRINVIHNINQGVSAARNIGIRIAKGNYIQFVDADDWIDREFLENAYTKITKELSDVVFMGIKYQNLEDKFVIEKLASNDLVYNANKNIYYDAIRLMKEDLFGFTWCKLLKKSIIDDNNIFFDETISLAEDEKFTCDYYRYVQKISISDRAYYNYVKHGKKRKNLCSIKVNDILNKDKIFNSWVKLLKSNNNDKFIKEYLSNKSFHVLYEEVYNIYFNISNMNEREIRLNQLKNTHLYKYLLSDSINIYQKLLLFLINNNNIKLFKLFNKIYYTVKSTIK